MIKRPFRTTGDNIPAGKSYACSQFQSRLTGNGYAWSRHFQSILRGKSCDWSQFQSRLTGNGYAWSRHFQSILRGKSCDWSRQFQSPCRRLFFFFVLPTCMIYSFNRFLFIDLLCSSGIRAGGFLFLAYILSIYKQSSLFGLQSSKLYYTWKTCSREDNRIGTSCSRSDSHMI